MEKNPLMLFGAWQCKCPLLSVCSFDDSMMNNDACWPMSIIQFNRCENLHTIFECYDSGFSNFRGCNLQQIFNNICNKI